MSISKRAAYAAYRVLVVDDQEEMVDLLSRMLRRLGFNDILFANSAAEAEEFFGNNRFHLILTDYSMKGNTGLDLTRKLRQGSVAWVTRRDVPIIMVTGHGERSYVLAAKEAGVNAFLVKPVDIGQMEEKIGVLLNKPAS